jgi:hypothetical protein
MFPQVMMWPACVVRSIYCGRADVQHPRCIANAARIHRHINDLLFDLRGETGVGICQEKGPSTPSTARTAPIALLAFRGCAMAHNIRVLAVRAMEYVRYHCGSLSYRWFCSAQTLVKDSISTDLKHLPLTDGARSITPKTVNSRSCGVRQSLLS